MKRTFFNILLSIASLGVIASISSCGFKCVQGSGHPTTESRMVTQDFSKIEVSGGFKVILKQDSSGKIGITADDNLIQYIKTKNEDGTLHIFSHKHICSGDITITVSVKKLDEIRSSGTNEISSDGKLVCKDLEMHFSGMTKADLDLNVANLSIETSGTSELQLRGQATSNHVETSGMVQLHGFDFVVSDYEISTSGASHCEINALHSLHVSSSGASEVKYKGNPSDISNDKSGASSLEKVE